MLNKTFFKRQCTKTHEHKNKGFKQSIKRYTAYKRKNKRREVDTEREEPERALFCFDL